METNIKTSYRIFKLKRLKKIFLILLFYQSLFVFAQSDTLKTFTFSGFGEVYYSYDFSNPSNHEKPDFIYNNKRHNEINANLILIKANYSKKNIRSNIGLMLGNYAQYNLSSEPVWAQFIYEANMGIKLSDNHSIWLDAGVMPSHIGFESAISADCWTLTRSLLAENSPYYETGLKLSFVNQQENLNLSLLVLNGWQRIFRLNDIQRPSFGMQLNYKPNQNLIINYSNFLGSIKPDSLHSVLTFHNLYFQYEPKGIFGVVAGFDIGTQAIKSSGFDIWYSPVLIIRSVINDKIRIAVRGEYYFDKHQIIISTNSANGFKVSGLSSNIDYLINTKATFRVEGKIYHSRDRIFKNEALNNFALTTNLTFRF